MIADIKIPYKRRKVHLAKSDVANTTKSLKGASVIACYRSTDNEKTLRKALMDAQFSRKLFTFSFVILAKICLKYG